MESRGDRLHHARFWPVGSGLFIATGVPCSLLPLRKVPQLGRSGSDSGVAAYFGNGFPLHRRVDFVPLTTLPRDVAYHQPNSSQHWKVHRPSRTLRTTSSELNRFASFGWTLATSSSAARSIGATSTGDHESRSTVSNASVTFDAADVASSTSVALVPQLRFISYQGYRLPLRPGAAKAAPPSNTSPRPAQFSSDTPLPITQHTWGAEHRSEKCPG